MNVNITTFINPFSFFCKLEDEDNIPLTVTGQNNQNPSKDVFSYEHGQYVAVRYENKWARGVVMVDTQFLIWLIDYGIYLRPNEKTVYVDLPAVHKTLPTKVFEASIHGVSPVDKVMTFDCQSTYDCQIADKISTKWTQGATARSLELIDKASKVVFMPVAVLSTTTNHIVIGDLYLKLDERFVNIIDELATAVLQKNKEIYINCLETYYGNNQSKHPANKLKPELPKIFKTPTITLQTTLAEYNAICAEAPELDEDETCSSDSDSDYNSTACTYVRPQLTPAQEKEYANKWVTWGGKKYNYLKLVKDKIKDMQFQDKFKNVKYIGRACGRKPIAPKDHADD